MPRLRISSPGERDLAFEFQADPITIGTSEACHLRLSDPGAESKHCMIEPLPDGTYKLVDLETKAGTCVNGDQVNVRILRNGDRIEVGRTALHFEDPAESETKTDRIRPLRLGRRRHPLRRRRAISLPPPPQQQVFTLEDFRVVVDALVQERGPDVLEEVRKLLDRVYEEHKGTPLYEGLVEERDRLYRILEINKLINSEHHLKNLLEVILDTVVELAGAERAFLILREKEGLSIQVARNFDREAIRKPEFKISHSIAEEVLRSGKPILSADALNDPNLPAAGSVTDLKLRSIACLPFRVRDQVLGCVYVDNRFETHAFLEADLPLLQGFTDQAAIAIENARLFEENQAKREELSRSKEEIERLNAQLRDRVEKQYAELAKVKRDLTAARKDVPLKFDFSSIVGRSAAMREVFHVLDRVLDTDQPILIQGESGTGKELVARAIHFNSKRAKTGRFVGENCGAIPDTLLESELFGHERGAFTGAVASKEGLFESAHRGTLFLDEIGDMSLEMQKRLLRAIQEREIRRVGGREVILTDVRLLSASNRDLADLVRKGLFREDLFYRVNVVTITLPPLRERKEDIPLLVDYFVDRIAKEEGAPPRTLDERVLPCLQGYDWPGNIRELENEIRRAAALSGDTITLDSLKEEIRSQDIFRPVMKLPTGSPLKETVRKAMQDVERKIILKVLEETGWTKTEAARILGISRPTLDSKIELYQLEKP